MPILYEDTVNDLREWNVSIDDKQYQVKLQEVTKRSPGCSNSIVLKLIISYENFEEFSEEFKQNEGCDYIFEFSNSRFLFRKGKSEEHHDLYIDGKLIY